MRARFLLIPPAIIACAPALAGAFYLNIEQAQHVLFPGATFTKDFRTLSGKDMEAIHDETQVSPTDPTFHLWRVSTGDWFIIDQVLGRADNVTYAIGLDRTGAIKGIEVMECWEDYSKVRLPAWRAQFKGKRRGEVGVKHRSSTNIGGSIETISGTTLSSTHITEGVSRVLATFGLIMAKQQGQGQASGTTVDRN